jgi:hypothetical protein
MNRSFLILICVILVLGVSSLIIAEEFKEGIRLSEGKNSVNLSYEFNPIYVKDLVKIYPDITTITYNNGEQEVGYVNVLGGVGENFVISPDNIYEITTKEEVTLDLK